MTDCIAVFGFEEGSIEELARENSSAMPELPPNGIKSGYQPQEKRK